MDADPIIRRGLVMQATLAGKSGSEKTREGGGGKGYIKYSVVIPLYNEEESIRSLYTQIVEVMDGVSDRYEVVLVDDGSTDGTPRALEEIAANDTRVSAIRLRKNFGQTAALQAGFDFARGEIIISLDGDLQHDPAEIPQFLAKIEEGYDLVSGWRVRREDTWLTRQLPSRIANGMMARLSGVPIHDFGTTFKAYRRELIRAVRLYGEHHRFIPALASWFGARIAEVPIKNIPRKNGRSNYGIWRTPRVLLDLISIKFLLEYSTRPLQFFGLLGLSGMGAGTTLALGLAFKKLVLHEAVLLQHGLLLFMAMLLILGGLQFLSVGLIGEMVTRTYYESQRKSTYAVREIKTRREPSDVEGTDQETIPKTVGWAAR